MPGVKDMVSGYATIRLVALRNAIRSQAGRLLLTDGLGRERGAVLAHRPLRAAGRDGALGRAARPAEPSQPGAAVGGRHRALVRPGGAARRAGAAGPAEARARREAERQAVSS